MKNQKRAGVLLSYLNTALNMGFNLFLIPMLIAALTDAQYGVYKVIQSFASPLMMLNLGMSTIAARAIAQYQIRSDDQGRRDKENTVALAVAVSAAMAMAVCILGWGMTRLLPVLFSGTYSREELVLAEKLLGIFVGTTALHILSDTFRGCVLGRERFVFYYGSATVQYVIRFGAIALLTTRRDLDAVSVALVDLVLYAGLLAANLLYSTLGLRERFRFHGLKKQELFTIASFSAAILLQAIVNQVNNNVDNVILGAMIADKQTITMYSSALSIFGIYNSLLSVLTNVYFPKAARMVAAGSDGETLTDFVIGPGRIQAVIAVGVLTAFGLFGGNFVTIWIGQRYLQTWYVAWVLMVPVTIPLVQNLCLAILSARLKQMFRSAVLCGMAVANVCVSVLLVPRMGYWGAALGTVLSLLLGHGIVMNLYYHKVLKLNVVRMFREIFRGILPAGILSGVLCIPLAVYVENSFLGFLGKCLAFVAVYGALLWKLGFRESEKRMLADMLRKNSQNQTEI